MKENGQIFMCAGDECPFLEHSWLEDSSLPTLLPAGTFRHRNPILPDEKIYPVKKATFFYSPGVISHYWHR
jgi:hypothetical protein